MRVLALTKNASLLVALGSMMREWEVVNVRDVASALEAEPGAVVALIDLGDTPEGLKASAELYNRGITIPVVILGDEPSEVIGATVLVRPFSLDDLASAVREASTKQSVAPPRSKPAPAEPPAPPAQRVDTNGGDAAASKPHAEPVAPPEPEKKTPKSRPLSVVPPAAPEPSAPPVPKPPSAEERRDAELREARRAEAERQEARRVDAERKEVEAREARRQEAEHKEAERREAKRAELERQEAAHREAELLEAERREAERLEAERREAEREAERAAAERAEPESPAAEVEIEREPDVAETPPPAPAARQQPPPPVHAQPRPHQRTMAASAATAPAQIDPEPLQSQVRKRFLRGSRPQSVPEQQLESPLVRRLKQAAMHSAELEALIDELPFISDLSSMADGLVSEVESQFNAQIASVFVRRTDGYHVIAHRGLSRVEAGMVVAETQPLISDVLQTGEGILIQPVDLAQGLVAGIGGARTEAIMAVPAVVHGACVAIVIVGQDHFTEDDLDRLSDLAGEAAPGLAVALALARLRERI